MSGGGGRRCGEKAAVGVGACVHISTRNNLGLKIVEYRPIIRIPITGVSSMIVVIAAAISISTLLSSPSTHQATKPAGVVSAQKSVISPAELFKKTSPYIVTIKTEDSTGTGFVAPNGYVYTAHHVIEGKKNIKAVFPDKREIPLGWVVAMNPAQDWVAFHSLEPSKLTFSTATSQEVGSKVVVIGSPRGLEQTITEGLMSGKRTVGQTSLLQVSAAVSPGSSGSPLFNDQGDVIGLVSSKLGESEQLTFAVPVSEFGNKIGIPISALYNQPSTNKAPSTEFTTEYSNWVSTITKDLPSESRDLVYLNSLQVRVYLDDVAKKYISEDTLSEWLKTAMGIYCPKISIVTQDEAKNITSEITKFEANTSFELLLRDIFEWDSFTRKLSIQIDALEGTSNSCYTIRTVLSRGSVGISGRIYSQVFSTGTFGIFGSKVDIIDSWKNVISEHIQTFAKRWQAANKDAK